MNLKLSKQRVFTFVGASMLSMAMVVPALAGSNMDDSPLTASVLGDPNAFNLTINANAAFTGPVTYNGDAAQPLCGSVGYEVEDGTGDNTGWNVQIGTTGDFTHTTLTLVPPIDDTNLTGNPTVNEAGAVSACAPITDPTPISGQGISGPLGGCTNGANSNGPIAWICDANVNVGGYGGKVLASNPNFGNGVYQQTTQLLLNIPAGTIAGNYTTGLVLTLNHGNPL